MAAKQIEALSRMFPRGGAEQPTEPAAAAPAKSGVAPSREGKLHVSAWLSPGYKVSLRAIQMKFPQKRLQDLFSEALNDLFAKHNVPTVRED